MLTINIHFSIWCSIQGSEANIVNLPNILPKLVLLPEFVLNI